MNWSTIGENFIAGVGVAIAVALLAWLVTDRYAARRERLQALRDRDLAAAAELYRVHGQFFAAWKVWDMHMGEERLPIDENGRVELARAAADAEGAYESLVIRIALEHHLGPDDEIALWCLRIGLKQLRYAIRSNIRLQWWRTGSEGSHPGDHVGFRAYQAFKSLLPLVADILITPDKKRHAKRRRIATRKQRTISRKVEARDTLRDITGDGTKYKEDARFALRFMYERGKQPPGDRMSGDNREWVVLAEGLDDLGNNGDPIIGSGGISSML